MRKKPDSRYEKCVDCGNEWNVAKHLVISDKYICPTIARGGEMMKRKKFNFWTLLPKLSIATASVLLST